MIVSNAALINYPQIYQIKDRRIIHLFKDSGILFSSKGEKEGYSSKFDDIAAKLRDNTETIKKDWSSLSIENQEELRNFAYNFLKPKTGISYIWYEVRAIMFILFLTITNQLKPFSRCIDALDYLIDTILDCVERSHPVYQAILSDALEELIHLNHEFVSEEESGDTRTWLQSLSNKAIADKG
jgi:hypothetical protein